jgi:hypothetical protein
MSLFSDALQQAVSVLSDAGASTAIVIAGKPYTGVGNSAESSEMQDAGDFLLLDASVTLNADDFTILPKVNDTCVMGGIQYFIKRINNQVGILVLGLSRQP